MELSCLNESEHMFTQIAKQVNICSKCSQLIVNKV